MPRKKIKNPITLLYPNALSVRDLKLEVLNYHKTNVKDRDFFLFFHILLEPYLCLDNRTDKYLQIHYSVVQDIFGRDYTKIIKALIAGEYILVNEYSSEYLGICKSYAIHPRLMDESKPVLVFNSNYDTVLHNKLERIGTLNLTKPADKDNPTPLDEGRQHIITMTQQMILKPDAAATAYVQAQYDETGNPNSPAAYFHHWNTNPMRQPHMDLFGRRMHSDITNMPKVLRRCLRFKSAPDVPTVEKDIVNAQPFFLSVIDAELINQFAPECSSAVPVYAKYRAKPDYIEFTELCTAGGIYESFIERYFKRYNERYGVNDKDARDITKGLVYGVFFGDYKLILKGLETDSRTELTRIKKQFFELFMNEFESVYQLFTELKSLYWSFTVNKRGVYKQYANNCLLAQRIESGIMYERVIPDLLMYDIVDVVTVHDCVIVKETDAVTVAAIMAQSFASLNLNPKIQ